MFHTGDNFIDGIRIEVIRKRIRRINIRVEPEGTVKLSVPWFSTLAEGEAFLRSKWKWVVDAREKLKANRPSLVKLPITELEELALVSSLEELHRIWTERIAEPGVTWKIRAMKSLWGSCHWNERLIVYNLELARQPRELIEYVVVHELTHLKVHNHGSEFKRLMDERLPNWKSLRGRLRR